MTDFKSSNYFPSSFPQPTTKRLVDTSGKDFYPTPPWATRALLGCETFDGVVWEPACGSGEMAEVLREVGLHIMTTDLYDRGYGSHGVDFLKSDRIYDNIVTNPPYFLAEKFVLHALKLTRKKVAFLLRLAFLESAQRQEKIFKNHPPTRVWVFSERVSFFPKGDHRDSGGTTAYAWFVWDIRTPNAVTELRWIPLGHKPKARRKRSSSGRKLSLSDLA